MPGLCCSALIYANRNSWFAAEALALPLATTEYDLTQRREDAKNRKMEKTGNWRLGDEETGGREEGIGAGEDLTQRRGDAEDLTQRR